MPLRLELKASNRGPGHGLLKVSGWTASTSGLEMAVQRNQDGHYLNAQGSWSGDPVWHALHDWIEQDDSLNGELGPWLVDPLVSAPNVAYMFELRADGQRDRGVLRMVGPLFSSQAAGNSQREEHRAQHAAIQSSVREERPPVPIEPPRPAIQAETPAAATPLQQTPAEAPLTAEKTSEPAPAPRPSYPAQPAPKWPLILLLVLLLAAAAALAWFFLLRDSAPTEDAPAAPESAFTDQNPIEPAPTEPAPAETASPAPAEAVPPASDSVAAAGPCAAASLQGAEDMSFIQTCLKSAPSTDQLLATIQLAQAGKRCEVVQRLFAHRAQGGDARMAFLYAQVYDPDTQASSLARGCIDKPDRETAAYWYEIALDKDATHLEARRRLGLQLTSLYSSGLEFERGLGHLRQAADAGDNDAKQQLQKLGK